MTVVTAVSVSRTSTLLRTNPRILAPAFSRTLRACATAPLAVTPLSTTKAIPSTNVERIQVPGDRFTPVLPVTDAMTPSTKSRGSAIPGLRRSASMIRVLSPL